MPGIGSDPRNESGLPDVIYKAAEDPFCPTSQPNRRHYDKGMDMFATGKKEVRLASFSTFFSHIPAKAARKRL